uniref:CSON004545 protein n=1 Tax=Culicoides sonorensis TaxID=179676 RepID=A0A336LTM1_CULSO
MSRKWNDKDTAQMRQYVENHNIQQVTQKIIPEIKQSFGFDDLSDIHIRYHLFKILNAQPNNPALAALISTT